VLEDNLKPTIKPQYVDHIPRAVKGNVGEVLSQKDERGEKQNLLDVLGKEGVSKGLAFVRIRWIRQVRKGGGTIIRTSWLY
jgi:translation initiation factor RLI1